MKVRSVFCVGAGGIGTHFAPVLSRLLRNHPDGCRKIQICDGDAYEESNLTRQHVKSTAVGRNKAVVLAEEINAMHGTTLAAPAAVSLDHYVPSSHIATMHLGLNFMDVDDPDVNGCQLVALCVDNDKTRKMFYNACRSVTHPIALVDMGNELTTASAVLSLWDHGKCVVTVAPDEIYENLRNPADRAPGGGCMAMIPSTPQLMMANVLAATMGLMQVQSILDEETFEMSLKADLRACKILSIGECFNVRPKADDATPTDPVEPVASLDAPEATK